MPTPHAIAFFARVRADRGLKQKLERDPSPANLIAVAAAAGYAVSDADAAALLRQWFGARDGETGEDQHDPLRDQESPPSDPEDENDRGGVDRPIFIDYNISTTHPLSRARRGRGQG